MNAEYVTTKLKALKSGRAQTDAWRDRVGSYLIPEWGSLRSYRAQSEKRIFTSRPQLAFRDWRNGMQGHFVSSQMPWFRFKMGTDELNDNYEVKRFMAEAEEQVYYAFTRSGFYSALDGYFADGGALGTAVQYIDSRGDKTRFINEPAENVWLDIDFAGDINCVVREFELTAGQIVSQFSSCCEATKIAAKMHDQTKHKIIHLIEPNLNIDRQKADYRGKPYLSVYVDSGEDEVLEVGGHSRLKCAVWRPRVIPGLAYGVGPAYDCLADIEERQQLAMDRKEARNLMLRPPLQAPADMRGRLNLRPGGISYYDSPTGPISAVNTGVNYPVGVDSEREIDEIISEHFWVDFFLMLNRAQGQKTATEILEMQGEKAAVMGSLVNNLSNDYLDLTVTNMFFAELEAGRLPDVPDVLAEANVDIDIEYLGLISQAQRRYLKTVGIKSSLADAAGAIQLNPEAADVVDTDAFVREIFEANCSNPKVVRSMEEVMAIRQQRAEMQQRAQQMQEMQQMADAAGKASRKIEQGSPLDALAQMTGVV